LAELRALLQQSAWHMQKLRAPPTPSKTQGQSARCFEHSAASHGSQLEGPLSA
jgi:hypothetical protein